LLGGYDGAATTKRLCEEMGEMGERGGNGERTLRLRMRNRWEDISGGGNGIGTELRKEVI